MSTRVTASSSGGIGFVGLLTILFIALKLLGITAVASWSWWWVLSPSWIAFGLSLVGLLIFGIFVLVAIHLDK
jgi:hypothetical protein